MHPSFTKIDHRPWSLPKTEWIWRQSWNDLLFVHYPVDASEVQKLVPADLKIQEFEGQSYVGIVPFRMNGVMRRPFPDVPWFSSFLELNVRLYVEYDGKPGVWFLSLDATNPFVVWGGNRFFGLPYKRASMSTNADGSHTNYQSRRLGVKSPADFEVRFLADKETYFAEKGSLEYFLTERYCFYSQIGKQLYRADVHHHPWPIQKAQGEIIRNTLIPDIKLATGAPLFHYSTGVDVASWNPEKVPA